MAMARICFLFAVTLTEASKAPLSAEECDSSTDGMHGACAPEMESFLQISSHAVDGQDTAASFAGEYRLYHDGVKGKNLVIGCDGTVQTPGEFFDRLHFEDVKAKCPEEPDATMYVENTAGHGTFDCLRRVPWGRRAHLVGSRYSASTEFHSVLDCRVIRKDDC